MGNVSKENEILRKNPEGKLEIKKKTLYRKWRLPLMGHQTGQGYGKNLWASC